MTDTEVADGYYERYDAIYEPRGDMQVHDGVSIHLRVSANPHPHGTDAYRLFALYVEEMTIGEYVAAGGSREDVVKDRDRRYIALMPHLRWRDFELVVRSSS